MSATKFSGSLTDDERKAMMKILYEQATHYWRVDLSKVKPRREFPGAHQD